MDFMRQTPLLDQFLGDTLQPENWQRYWQEQRDSVQAMLEDPALRARLGENLEGFADGTTSPAGSAEAADKEPRFSDPVWEHNHYFAMLRQSYLNSVRLCEEMLDRHQFASSTEERQARFAMRQYLNAIAPSNSPLTNPEVLREILESGGKCLQRGWQNLLQDIADSPRELLRIRQSDPAQFEVGTNLANTPGQVVYENPLLQLIEYSASTKTVYEKPLLLVPPFVNKYYVLDLDRKKSLVRWLVARGYRVFMISWVNPGQSLANTSLEDYVTDGVIEAIESALEISGSDTLNATGYCTGGTLLSIAQAVLAARGHERLASISLLATQLDFSDPGELGVYLSEQLQALLQRFSERRGVFDGRLLATAFNLLRENELFWPYVIKRYLLGQEPAAFDILHWNNDSTNIPQHMLNHYVQAMYKDNLLVQANGLNINDTAVDLARITVPAYCLATRKDHIVSWQAAWRSSRYLGGPVRFVLGDSGHVAGVINPAQGGKYAHWTCDRPTPDADSWLANAEENGVSWWKDWNNWLKPLSGNRIAAPEIGSADYPPLEAAPGRYVRVCC
jgi:polyhydroxyalkanoate synthase